jgi:hypothetical protein
MPASLYVKKKKNCFFVDPKQAAEFMEKIKEKVKASDESRVLCMTTIGNIKLKSKDFDSVKVCHSGILPWTVV